VLDGLHHDDRVVDDNADSQHQGEQGYGVGQYEAKLTANVPISDTGTAISE
jgi:hypothetical protein